MAARELIHSFGPLGGQGLFPANLILSPRSSRLFIEGNPLYCHTFADHMVLGPISGGDLSESGPEAPSPTGPLERASCECISKKYLPSFSLSLTLKLEPFSLETEVIHTLF